MLVRYFAAFALILSLLRTCPVGATEYVSSDGAWWIAASDLQKVLMVQGLIAGLEEGWVAGASAVYSFSPSAKPYQTALKYDLQFSKSFGAYVDRIDAVEADGGAQKIPLAIVMICLADKNPNSTDCVNAWKKQYPSSP
jgi:hypothetical protein